MPSRARENPLAAMPLATGGLIALLCVIYAMQVRMASALPFDRSDLIGMGAIDGHLVFAGEWWRTVTATLLHGSASHLIGNCVALGMIGFYLEPLLGAGWLTGIFALAALGGSAGSLERSSPMLLSVGASGAISGILAAALVIGARLDDADRRRRMLRIALLTLVPATLPAFFAAKGAEGGTDYGAHIGGALTGVAVALVLSITWDRVGKHPRFRMAGAGFAAAFALTAALGFLLNTHHAEAGAAEKALLIPKAQVPATTEDGMRRAADLVAQYPKDPRGHLFRAQNFMRQNDLQDAAAELRTAIAILQEHPGLFSPQFDDSLKLTLALVIRYEGDMDAARAMARASCNRPGNAALLKMLRRETICR